MFRIGKSIEMESRLVVTKARGGEMRETAYECGVLPQSGGVKILWN